MLYRVDTKDDKAEAVDGVNVTKMYVKNDTAYCYVANYYNPDGKAAFTFDLKTDKVINPTFIKDFSVFTSDPSAIGVAVNVGCWSHRRGHIIFDKDLNYTIDTHSGVTL